MVHVIVRMMEIHMSTSQLRVSTLHLHPIQAPQKVSSSEEYLVYLSNVDMRPDEEVLSCDSYI